MQCQVSETLFAAFSFRLLCFGLDQISEGLVQRMPVGMLCFLHILSQKRSHSQIGKGIEQLMNMHIRSDRIRIICFPVSNDICPVCNSLYGMIYLMDALRTPVIVLIIEDHGIIRIQRILRSMQELFHFISAGMHLD